MKGGEVFFRSLTGEIKSERLTMDDGRKGGVMRNQLKTSLFQSFVVDLSLIPFATAVGFVRKRKFAFN